MEPKNYTIVVDSKSRPSKVNKETVSRMAWKEKMENFHLPVFQNDVDPPQM